MDAIMITGGQGFAGRHITHRLAAGGRRVISYNRDFATDEDGAHMVQGELFDLPRLVRVLKEHRIEQIVHTAAMSHPTLSLDFQIATFAANVEGTLSLLEAARLANVRRVVNFSSEAVYGATAGPLTEEFPVAPSTPYAVTVTAEWLGKVYCNRYALDVVSLRIGQVYGPGNRMPEVLGDMLKALTKTGVCTLAQGSDHGFNSIHVRDVALATERALVAPGPFAPLAYNISSGEYWQLGDVAALVRPMFPAGRLQIGPGPVASSTSKGRSTARRLSATSAMTRNGRSHAASPTTPHGSRRMRHDVGSSSARYA